MTPSPPRRFSPKKPFGRFNPGTASSQAEYASLEQSSKVINGDRQKRGSSTSVVISEEYFVPDILATSESSPRKRPHIDTPSPKVPRSTSQTSFRPRQLQISKPILVLPLDESEKIIHEEARMGKDFSLSQEDFDVYTAIGASFETDVSKGTLEFDVITNQSVAGLPQPASRPPRSISTPNFHMIEDISYKTTDGGFAQPRTLIRHSSPIGPRVKKDGPVEAARASKYEMDSEDEEFLARHNKAGTTVSDTQFETLIDKFEHSAKAKRLQMEYPKFGLLRAERIALDRLSILCDMMVRREKLKRSILEVNGQIHQAQIDLMQDELVANKLTVQTENRAKNNICTVCFIDSPVLETLECDKCGVHVHSSCYGPGRPTKTKWLCDWCGSKELGPPTCIFCPFNDGAVKFTKEGEWIHACCALFMPNVEVDTTHESYLISTSAVNRKRYNRKCMICKSKQGAVVSCDEEDCANVFHVMCAMSNGWHVTPLPSELDAGDSKFHDKDGVPDEKQFVCYCKGHTPVDVPSFQHGVGAKNMSNRSDMPLSPLHRLLSGKAEDVHSRRLTYTEKEVESALCAVCHDGESYKGDAIIFCDGCNMPVHQSCYGVPQVPVGDWFCARCAAGAPRVRCVLCPIKTGPFKRLDNGEWVHVVCALWMPGVYFENPDTMEGVRGIDKVDPARRRLTCCICHKREGACIQCSEKACYEPMHASCARLYDGALLQIHEDEDGQSGCWGYCKFHQEVGQRDAAVALDKKRSAAAIREEPAHGTRYKESQRNWDAEYLKHVPIDDAVKSSKLPLAVVQGVFRHWCAKRARIGEPLV